MRPAFYDDPLYKKRQAEITHKYWLLGRFDFKKKSESRICRNTQCSQPFTVKPHERKRFCSRSCSATISNVGRIISLESRIKRSLRMKGRPNPYKGIRKSKYISILCRNPRCTNLFERPPYKARSQKYCSILCAIKVVGSATTSPNAIRGKKGIRNDISPSITFYSTWEANIARVFNILNIRWLYAPTLFNIGLHTYRPDFYLPESNAYIEIKNFMGEYSLMRDREFRKRYPLIKLDIISKEEYTQIEQEYKPLIDEWE